MIYSVLSQIVSMVDAFSAHMATVYASGIAAGVAIFNTVMSEIRERRRRGWEIEDRKHKEKLSEKTQVIEAKADKAAVAAVAAVKVASNSAREIKSEIKESRQERKEQITGLVERVEANTNLTQASKDASENAIEASNNLTSKLKDVVEVANAALDVANKK